MKRTLIVLATLAALTGAAFAQTVEELRHHEKVLDGMCRASLDPGEQRDAACCGRAMIGIRINQLGWCYGKDGQTGDKMAWHRCARGSQRFSLGYCKVEK